MMLSGGKLLTGELASLVHGPPTKNLSRQRSISQPLNSRRHSSPVQVNFRQTVQLSSSWYAKEASGYNWNVDQYFKI
jgi:hypothetical protein